MVKNDNPKKIPKRTKLMIAEFFLIFNKNNKDRDQKKTKTTSVDNKKDDTLTAGKR